jgi:hypothetical protein
LACFGHSASPGSDNGVLPTLVKEREREKEGKREKREKRRKRRKRRKT